MLFAFPGKTAPAVLPLSCNETTAAWEKELNSAILGERLVSDFFKNKDNGFIINSFSSAQSVEKLFTFRKLAGQILADPEGSSLGEIYVASQILKNTDAVSFIPLTGNEQKLILSADNINRQKLFIPAQGFAGRTPPPEYSKYTLCTVLNFFSRPRLKNRNNRSMDIKPVYKISYAKLFFEISFTDFYRLFLYLKDSSGNADCFSITHAGIPSSPPSVSIIPHHHKITSKNKINLKGALP